MIIDKDSQFIVRLLEKDKRTGITKGTVLNPKGLYWNKGKVILVGNVNESGSLRLSLPQDIVEVEVLNTGE